MSSDLAALRKQPFELLQALESRVRMARLDTAAGQTATWMGLAFRLREHWCVAPRDDVREVITVPRLTRVPGARAYLLGMANVRGSLLPVTDLGEMLGSPRAIADRSSRVLVYNSDRVPAGFLVDEVVGYRHFTPGEQRHSLAADAGALTPYLLGAFEREGRPWLVLSLRKLTQAPAFTNVG